jgi:hypothetical protein
MSDVKAKLWSELYKSRAPLSKKEREAKLAGKELPKEEYELDEETLDLMEGSDLYEGMSRDEIREMDEEEIQKMIDADAEEVSKVRAEDKASNKALAKKLSPKSEDTMSIIKHLQKNVPEEAAPVEEEELLEIDDSEESHPILKKNKKVKIFE